MTELIYVVIATGVNGDSVECVGSPEEAKARLAQLAEDGWGQGDLTLIAGHPVGIDLETRTVVDMIKLRHPATGIGE